MKFPYFHTALPDFFWKRKSFLSISPLAKAAVIRYENGVIEENPMQRMKKPKARKDEIQKEAVVYSESEIAYIMDCLNKEPLKWKAL